jgi:hypothetical protein
MHTPSSKLPAVNSRSAGAKKINVVERQAVAVLSRGTLTDAEMVGAAPDAAYVMAGENFTAAQARA